MKLSRVIEALEYAGRQVDVTAVLPRENDTVITLECAGGVDVDLFDMDGSWHSTDFVACACSDRRCGSCTKRCHYQAMYGGFAVKCTHCGWED